MRILKNRFKKLLGYKFIRYVIGGGSAALLDLCILYILTDILGVYYLLSAIIAFVLSLFYGYMFHKRITFQSSSKRHVVHGTRFLSFQLIGMVLYMGILRLFVDVFGWRYMGVAVGAKCIVVIRNYTMNHLYNFKD